MVKMFFFSLRSGYHVINISLDLVMNHIVEQSDHDALISFPDILQPERHHLVIEGACDTVGELTMVLRFFSQMFRLSKSRHRLFILS